MEQDRRGFLRFAGAAAFTTSLFTGDIRGANDKVNIAFIGVGRMGSKNLGFAAKTPGVNVAAVCDVYQPALQSAVAQAKKLGFRDVKTVKDFQDILADQSIDAVCIATPDRWHAYITMEACKEGKDVWLEKPACAYIDEGVKMVEAARKYQRVVQAGTTQRSSGYFRKAREIVKRGDLGDITFCRVFQAGGAMTDWGVDLMDIVQFVFDEAMPLSVAAQGGKLNPTDKLATYRYPGFVASYESRTVKPGLLDDRNHGIAFHGTEATLRVNRSGYWLYPNDNKPQPLQETSKNCADMNMPHWANFLECIHSRRKPTSDIETCVRSTTTCLLANLAHRHTIALDWDDNSFTVKQRYVLPLLKASYRAPWRLEV